MKIRNLAVAAIALTLPFAAVACGADSTGELDKDDLVKELTDSGMDEATADCAADAMIDADFTKDELDKLNAGDTGVDEKKTEAFTNAIAKCVTANTDVGN